MIYTCKLRKFIGSNFKFCETALPVFFVTASFVHDARVTRPSLISVHVGSNHSLGFIGLNMGDAQCYNSINDNYNSLVRRKNVLGLLSEIKSLVMV